MQFEHAFGYSQPVLSFRVLCLHEYTSAAVFGNIVLIAKWESAMRIDVYEESTILLAE